MIQRKLDKWVWFTLDGDGKLDGICGIHVDDMIGAIRADRVINKACEILTSRLCYGIWKHDADLTFTGCEVKTVQGEEQVKQLT